MNRIFVFYKIRIRNPVNVRIVITKGVFRQARSFFQFFEKGFFTSALTFDEVAVESLKRDTAFVQKADHKFSFPPLNFSLWSALFLWNHCILFLRWPFLYNTPNKVTKEIENRRYRQRDTDSFGNVHSTQKAFQTFTFLNIFMEFKRWSSFSER